MSKYIDAEKLIAEIENMFDYGYYCTPKNIGKQRGRNRACREILSIITSLQQEHEIVEFSFKGGTYRVNGNEHAFKGGKAKVIILEINQEEGNE